MTEIKQPKLVPVRVLSTTGKSALVEWVDKGGIHRASLPAEKVAEKIDQDTLDAAVPYGVPWADMPFKPFTGQQLQAALYAAGVWTDETTNKRPDLVIGALQALLWVHYGSLVEFAAKHKLSEVK